MGKKLRTAGAAATLGGVAWLTTGFWLPQLGAAASGDRAARISQSPNFDGKTAKNLIDTPMGMNAEMRSVAWEYLAGGQEREPSVTIPIEHPDPSALKAGTDDLRVTWMGHSTLLIEVDGHLVLTDPVFSQRTSPVQWAGPKRFHPTPIDIADLPDVDVVLISHDHYDHLDYDSIRELSARGARFAVPLGVGAHLESWGVDPERITELDWWGETTVGSLRLVSTPARHFSGRGMLDRNHTLWTSWAILGPQHRVWFSGDTGPFEAAAEIGERLGPFDLAMIEIGAFHPAWGNIHLGPDEAAKMHERVGASVLMPIHWGTFNLALHDWDQPIVRLSELADERGFALHAPLAGQITRPAQPTVAPFWRERIQLRADEASGVAVAAPAVAAP